MNKNIFFLLKSFLKKYLQYETQEDELKKIMKDLKNDIQIF